MASGVLLQLAVLIVTMVQLVRLIPNQSVQPKAVNGVAHGVQVIQAIIVRLLLNLNVPLKAANGVKILMEPLVGVIPLVERIILVRPILKQIVQRKVVNGVQAAAVVGVQRAEADAQFMIKHPVRQKAGHGVLLQIVALILGAHLSDKLAQ